MARERTTLTKSLHTVTAVSRVALMLAALDKHGRLTASDYARQALEILGQPNDWPVQDATFAACVAAVERGLTSYHASAYSPAQRGRGCPH